MADALSSARCSFQWSRSCTWGQPPTAVPSQLSAEGRIRTDPARSRFAARTPARQSGGGLRDAGDGGDAPDKLCRTGGHGMGPRRSCNEGSPPRLSSPAVTIPGDHGDHEGVSIDNVAGLSSWKNGRDSPGCRAFGRHIEPRPPYSGDTTPRRGVHGLPEPGLLNAGRRRVLPGEHRRSVAGIGGAPKGRESVDDGASAPSRPTPFLPANPRKPVAGRPGPTRALAGPLQTAP